MVVAPIISPYISLMEAFLDLIASSAADSEVFAWLQEHTAGTDPLGQTLLHHLLKSQRPGLLADYLSATPDLDQAFQAKDCWGNAPAHYLKDSHSALLVAKHVPNAYKVLNSCKETPLHRIHGHTKWTDFGELLIVLNPDLDTADSQGQSIKSILLGKWWQVTMAYWEDAIAGNRDGFVAFRQYALQK